MTHQCDQQTLYKITQSTQYHNKDIKIRLFWMKLYSEYRPDANRWDRCASAEGNCSIKYILSVPLLKGDVCRWWEWRYDPYTLSHVCNQWRLISLVTWQVIANLLRIRILNNKKSACVTPSMGQYFGLVTDHVRAVFVNKIISVY